MGNLATVGYTSMGKYITIINKYSRLSVPFRITEEDEIKIISTNPKDTDEDCEVVIGNLFYEDSLDLDIYIRKLHAKNKNI